MRRIHHVILKCHVLLFETWIVYKLLYKVPVWACYKFAWRTNKDYVVHSHFHLATLNGVDCSTGRSFHRRIGLSSVTRKRRRWTPTTPMSISLSDRSLTCLRYGWITRQRNQNNEPKTYQSISCGCTFVLTLMRSAQVGASPAVNICHEYWLHT